MNAIILTVEQYQELLTQISEIKNSLSQQQKNPSEIFVDNQEFIDLMKISKRTAQHWRDTGVISFSQIGSKIYYRMSDIEELLNSNYNKSFK
jgi:putative IMPACT (imprinted ancient) family translation regulator